MLTIFSDLTTLEVPLTEPMWKIARDPTAGKQLLPARRMGHSLLHPQDRVSRVVLDRGDEDDRRSVAVDDGEVGLKVVEIAEIVA